MSRPLIIGGGPAGSAAAIGLARSGAPALLIERTRETQDAICGGFLSWQTLAAIERLGIDADALGGHRVDRLRLFAGERMIERRLPCPGMGLSRRRMDGVLLGRAEGLGTGIERGVTIRRVAPGEANAGDGGSFVSDVILLACGKHGMADQPRPAPGHAARDPVLGLRLRIAASAAGRRLVGGAVELFLFDRGYAGLVVQEDGSINLCLAVHKSRFAEAGSRPDALIGEWGALNPRLGERLASGAPTSAIDAIAAVPYGWRVQGTQDGLWRLGDQAACIPSLAGEGMGIAIASAASAVTAWRQGVGSEAWQRRFSVDLRRPMTVARGAWRVAEQPGLNAAALAGLGRAPWLIDWLARATRVPA